MLVVFKSKAAAEITMLSQHAQPLLEQAGKAWSERGVFTVEQLPAAISHLEAAMHQEPAPRGAREEDDEPAEKNEHVTVGQRAYPLVEMLRAAHKMQVPVMWEM